MPWKEEGWLNLAMTAVAEGLIEAHLPESNIFVTRAPVQGQRKKIGKSKREPG
jgi:hypothetical protein